MLYSAFVYHAQQKFVVMLTLADWLIEITDRVKLWQWEEFTSELKCRLSRGKTFNWKRKQELSKLLKEQYKSRKDAEQKKFIISILILI